VVLGWVFWPTFVDLANRWDSDARYSHGWLVPLFALYLLWSRRGVLALQSSPVTAWGLALLGGGLLLRVVGSVIYIDWFRSVSLLPCLAGCVLLVGGWQALRWSWPGIAYLVLMLPLPHRVEGALAHPLQRIATISSNYLLQTIGFASFAQGNVIRMGDVKIGVVEACSGLSMLITFFALSTAVALLMKRPWPQRIVIFLSAIPIAVASNVIRITVTGILYKTASADLARLVFHDLAGWLMMPLGLGLLWVELCLISWVLPQPIAGESKPIAPVGLPAAAVRVKAASAPGDTRVKPAAQVNGLAPAAAPQPARNRS
jgi:exosortase